MNNSVTTKSMTYLLTTSILSFLKGGKPEPAAVLMSEDLYLGKENLCEAEEWLNVLKNLFRHTVLKNKLPPPDFIQNILLAKQ